MAEIPEVQRLIDVQEIIGLTIAYCWALDSRKWHELESIFDPDAEAVLGRTRVSGLEAISEHCRRSLEVLDVSQHLVGSHQVSLESDLATCRCQVIAQHRRDGAPGGSSWLIGGTYEDLLRRTKAGWRISRRVLSIAWAEGNRDVLGST